MPTVWRGQFNSTLNIFGNIKMKKSASVCHQPTTEGVKRLELARELSPELQQHYEYHLPSNRPVEGVLVTWPQEDSFYLLFFIKMAKNFFFLFYFFFFNSCFSVKFWPCWAWRAQRGEVAQVLEIIVPCWKSLRTLPSLSPPALFFFFFSRLIWCLGAVSPIYFLLPALAAEF